MYFGGKACKAYTYAPPGLDAFSSQRFCKHIVKKHQKPILLHLWRLFAVILVREKNVTFSKSSLDFTLQLPINMFFTTNLNNFSLAILYMELSSSLPGSLVRGPAAWMRHDAVEGQGGRCLHLPTVLFVNRRRHHRWLVLS